MRSAAQRQEDGDPGPAPEDPGRKAARVLDAHLALIERADALLGSWRDACPQDSQAVPALRELITETIGAGLHAEEMRQALAAQTATAGVLDAAFKAGRAAERAEREAPPAHGRHAAEPRRKGLRLVGGGGGVAAFAGAAFTGLRHAWAAHPVYTAAAGFTTVATLTAATAVVAPHAAATFGAGSPPAPAPAASVYSAVPVTGPSIATFVTKPKGGKSGTLSLNMPPTVPPYAPQGAYPPPGSGNGQGPSQPSSLPASAPDVRLVVTGALDLGTAPSGTIRLAAYGGTVSWSASSSVAGLTLDSDSGTLQAGDAATITVTIGADLQALTGPGSVTITYGNGKTATVPVSWVVVPLPVPTVVPTDVLPTDLPVVTGT